MKKPEMTARTFRLPETTTQEYLELLRQSVVVKFGSKVLLAGYYYMGQHAPSWFGAVYRFTTGDESCEGPVQLCKISQEFFEDEGHALQWAMQN